MTVEDLYNIYVVDDNGIKRSLDPLKATLSRYRQTNKLQPRQLVMSLDRGAAVKRYDTIIVEKMGTVIFRGYVKFYQINNKQLKTLTCYGMEDLLLFRYTPTFYYDQYSNTTFDDILNDRCLDAHLPGLLATANSYLMPANDWSAHNLGVNNIYVLHGLGTSSDLGTCKLFWLHWAYLKELEDMKTLAQLEASAAAESEYIYYRDAYDLYIQTQHTLYNTYWHEAGGIYAENHKDTTVRLGRLATPDTQLDGTLLTYWSKIGDLIINLCAAHDLHVTFTDDWYYTYCNVDEVEGREPDNGVYKFYESDLIEISKRNPSSVGVHGLTGRGMGFQYYTRNDHKASSHIKIEQYVDFPTEFKDANGKLKVLTDDEFETLNKDDLWTIRPVARDLILLPGDWIKLIPSFENQQMLKVDTINEDVLSGIMTIDLSEHKISLSDVFQFMQAIDQGFTQHYPWSYVANVTATVELDVDLSGNLVFALQENVLDLTWKPRVMLTLSMVQSVDIENPVDANEVGRCTIWVFDAGHVIRLTNVPIGSSVGWSIPPMDVTDMCYSQVGEAAGADVTLQIQVSSSWVIDANTNITANGSLTFYKRAG